jgi:hypothetical protein
MIRGAAPPKAFWNDDGNAGTIHSGLDSSMPFKGRLGAD